MGTLMLSREYQSAHMSKITNDSLTWSSTGCFIAVPYGNSGRQIVKANCWTDSGFDVCAV